VSESGFTSLDMGNIYHEALERYSKKLDRESTDWFSVTDAKRDELAMEAINEVIDEYTGFGIFDTAESQHSISHMKAVFKQTVWALTTQIRRGSFVPERFEFSFYESLDMANDVTVDIKGRVDRTDTYTDEGRLFVKVLDYKSGNTVFDLVKLILWHAASACSVHGRCHGTKERGAKAGKCGAGRYAVLSHRRSCN